MTSLRDEIPRPSQQKARTGHPPRRMANDDDQVGHSPQIARTGATDVVSTGHGASGPGAGAENLLERAHRSRRKGAEVFRRTVRIACERREEIDPIIERNAEHWRMDRMAAVDRNLLRAGVAEFLGFPRPQAVVINEALEIAGDSRRRNRCSSSTEFWTASPASWGEEKQVSAKNAKCADLRHTPSSLRCKTIWYNVRYEKGKCYIYSKGQLVIPAELRRKHGIKAGTKVCFLEDQFGRIILQPVTEDYIARVRAVLPGGRSW